MIYADRVKSHIISLVPVPEDEWFRLTFHYVVTIISEIKLKEYEHKCIRLVL